MLVFRLLECKQYQELMKSFQDAIHGYHSICSQKNKMALHEQQQTTDIEMSLSELLLQHQNEGIKMIQETLRSASERLSHSIQYTMSSRK